MYLKFAWRYFKGKKSATAINIIAWVTTAVIAFATCCQVLVLSVFNGFEDLVKSLYATFYSDLKIVPAKGKTLTLTANQLSRIKQMPGIKDISLIAEEKALLKNSDAQSVVNIKGVDGHFEKMSGVPGKLTNGKFNTGTAEDPKIIVGVGIQNAAGIVIAEEFAPEPLTIILPKKNSESTDPFGSLSEGNVTASAAFAIQQDFDNKYIFSNLDFVKQQMGLSENEYTAAEIKIRNESNSSQVQEQLQEMLGSTYVVQSKYQQNSSIYNTMRIEKWAIFAVLTLILIIAAFNMISSLTMLVLEKKQDIAILQSMGSTATQVKKIFISEGFLLAGMGACCGMLLAFLVCMAQLKFKLIKLQGGSFLIDYFPVKMILTDFLLVAATTTVIALLASWFPSVKAARQPLELR